jgi:hypothetical protein
VKRAAPMDREARMEARVERMRAQLLAPRHQPAPARPAAPAAGLVDAAMQAREAPAKRREAPRAAAKERAHMDRVARLGCVLCRRLGLAQAGKTDVHHLREGQGMAQRSSNWLVAGLCHERCHQGPTGVHGDRSLLRQAKATELDLLAWTLADLAEADACGKR